MSEFRGFIKQVSETQSNRSATSHCRLPDAVEPTRSLTGHRSVVSVLWGFGSILT